MPPFSNIALDYQNFSFGPVSGRVYSIDHITDTMIVKTLAGTLVSTIPLNTPMINEVLEMEFDGIYFWTLSSLGSGGTLGIVVNKWKINSSGTSLEKQLGIGNEINFLNSGSSLYQSNAFCVERYNTFLSFSVANGANTITVPSGSIDFLELGNSIYIGPSTSSIGEVLERKVIGILGNVITLDFPVTNSFNTNDKVTYRKSIWIFNNKHNLSDNGSLMQVNSYDGSLVSTYSSAEWKHVSAATFNNGNICFVRNFQLLRYRPFGLNTGYQNSAILNNVETDYTTIIPTYDIEIDDSIIYKLQRKQHQYDTLTHIYSDVTSTDNKYELDQEIIANKVTSITSTRDRSVLLGPSITADYIIQVRDQYDLPILGRAFSVTEDDASGFISPGFTSFTTNSNGQGTTRYNTGTSPSFRNPLIFATDIATQIRLELLLEQISNVSNTGFVQQEGALSNQGFVVQDKPQELTLIEQIQTINTMPVEQYITEAGLVAVEQLVTFGSGLVQQDPLLQNITLIQQDPDLDETATVIQYDFLIFAIPEPYSIKNAPDTDILVRIIGFGATPLNSSTLLFKVNGVDVTSQIVITPFGGGLELFYNPSVNFPYSSTVSVEISIQDTNLPPRTVSTFYTFDIVPDTLKPFIEEYYPPHHSINNLPLTEVYAIINDSQTGINMSSIKMYIEGKQVSPLVTQLDVSRVKVSYQPSEPFIYKADISAAVYVEDNENNKFVGSWIFTIKPSAGVLFNDLDPDSCSKLVPVDSDICIEVFGLEDGLDLDSLSFNVDGKNVIYALRPKVIRRN